MPNGSAVLHLVPKIAHDPLPKATSDAASAPALELEKIGAATADAIPVVFKALFEFKNGGLHPETRALSGAKVAVLFELKQANPDVDFAATMKSAGLSEMRRRYGAAWSQDYSGETFPEAVIVEACSWLTMILRQVTIAEQAFAAPMSSSRN